MHRELGHKVKGLTVCIFSEDEVKELSAWGNERAAKVWHGGMKKGSYPIPNPKDSYKLKEFMRVTYMQKRFYKSEESDDEDDEGSEEERVHSRGNSKNKGKRHSNRSTGEKKPEVRGNKRVSKQEEKPHKLPPAGGSKPPRPQAPPEEKPAMPLTTKLLIFDEEEVKVPETSPPSSGANAGWATFPTNNNADQGWKYQQAPPATSVAPTPPVISRPKEPPLMPTIAGDIYGISNADEDEFQTAPPISQAPPSKPMPDPTNLLSNLNKLYDESAPIQNVGMPAQGPSMNRPDPFVIIYIYSIDEYGSWRNATSSPTYSKPNVDEYGSGIYIYIYILVL